MEFVTGLVGVWLEDGRKPAGRAEGELSMGVIDTIEGLASGGARRPEIGSLGGDYPT